jgi:hypothetical protein
LLSLSAMVSQYFMRLAFFRGSSFADAARPTLFCAVIAVVAVLARVAWVTSCAGAAHVNLRRVPGCRCCLRHAREGASEYYGSDDCNSFHGFGHCASFTLHTAMTK